MNTTLEKDRMTTHGMRKDEFDAGQWRERFPSESYAVDSDRFEDYEPAYRFGSSLREEIDDFDLREADIRERWDQSRGDASLTWERAKEAVRAAWDDHSHPMDEEMARMK